MFRAVQLLNEKKLDELPDILRKWKREEEEEKEKREREREKEREVDELPLTPTAKKILDDEEVVEDDSGAGLNRHAPVVTHQPVRGK